MGNCSSACVYGSASIGGEFGLSIEPFRVSGSANAHASIGGCLKAKILLKRVGGCRDFGVWLTCHLQTPNPTKVSVSFSLDPPIPCVEDISITIGLVPPDFDWDVDWCI